MVLPVSNGAPPPDAPSISLNGKKDELRQCRNMATFPFQSGPDLVGGAVVEHGSALLEAGGSNRAACARDVCVNIVAASSCGSTL